MATFNDFPLNPQVKKALDTLGFSTPTEIQQHALKHLLGAEPVDFHGQAQTGTGKTLAFGIPLLNRIDPKNKQTQALIVAPTRELVLQISEALTAVAKFSDISVESIYGGVAMDRQLRALRKGSQIVVGTPGRLNDHLRRRTLSLSTLQTLVLDEADIMLDMGFKEEIDAILECTPDKRNIWLFSATVKPGIQAIKRQHMKDPITVAVAAKQVTAQTTKQHYAIVPQRYKLQALSRFIDCTADFYGIIFCRTKLLADDVAQALNKKGYEVRALHGDMNQDMRNKVIKGFKDKTFNILVATDVAARGIDVADLAYVINYCLPEDQESYVHRIGRTGRAGKEGTAITFVNAREVRRLQQVAQRFSASITPIEIPTSAQVVEVRVANSIKYIDEICTPTTKKVGLAASKIQALLDGRSKEDLVRGLSALLCDTVLRGVDEQQDDMSFASNAPSDQPFIADQDCQELMINMGSIDGITTKDVLRFLNTSSVLKGQAIGKIRVIQKRSFVHIPTDTVPHLLQDLRGKRYNGRPIAISIAQSTGR